MELIKCIFYILVYVVIATIATSKYDYIGNRDLNYTEMAAKYGFKAYEHSVVTEDGYILRLFHIPGTKPGLPVLLKHGLMASSDNFIIRGSVSLAITLARAGYDVWAGNSRGSIYSQRHLFLNPSEKIFWNYSFHEIGIYDLPAMIDLVLRETKKPKLNAIGHSQGNLIFYVMGSERPEYNSKVNTLTALAPICFLQYVKGQVREKLSSRPYFTRQLLDAGVVVVNNQTSLARRFELTVCSAGLYGYNLCTNKYLFPLTGYDHFQLEPEFYHVMLGHNPLAASTKNLDHQAQLFIRRRFSQYDYGILGNIIAYKSVFPPNYDFRKITMRVALFVGLNDNLSTLRASTALALHLPNVVKLYVIEYLKWNHLDFLCARDMRKYLYPQLLEFIASHNH